MIKPYPKYKASGVEWLGDVPEHWEVKRARFFMMTNPSKQEINHLEPETELVFLPMESVGEDGSLRKDLTRPIFEVSSGYTFFAEGDVTFAKITPCFENGKGAIMRDLGTHYGFGTTELTVIRPGASIDSEYLYYLTVSHEFRKNGEAWMYGAGGQKRVPDDFVREFRIGFPPLPEQQAIAAFLDRETGRIDTLIAKKERLLELLAEQRTALISDVVTGKINVLNHEKHERHERGKEFSDFRAFRGYSKYKASGVEWLGDVPEHWEVKRLKYQVSINDETLPEITSSDFEILYVDISSIDPTQGIIKKEEMIFDNAPSRARRIVRDGDTILSTVRTYLRAIAPVIEPEENLIVSTGFAVIRPLKMDKNYLSATVRTHYFIEEVVSRSVGVSYPAINASEIGTIPIPLPPLPEQQAIADFLDRETVKIDELSSKVRSAIDKLKEYRTALISAAVTGKIDVREAG